MRYKLFKVRLLLFLLFPFSLSAQFTYRIDQSIPVEVNGKTLLNPWAGGLNAAQINTLDLNADGQEDLVIFDKMASKISTFIAQNKTYHYAPEYEVLFPAEISTFMVLRDYNCDGKKDLFTFGQIGVLVFQNTTLPGQALTWKKLKFYNSDTGLKSDVLLTTGFSGKINLLPGTNDLPNFKDMDGDGDLDVLNMRFVSPSTAEYHRNFSMERYGRCDSLDLERQTKNWGGFLECSCGKIAFNGQTCAQIGGRTDHTGGKVLLTLDVDNDGDQDLLFSEETCSRLYFMENQGTPTTAALNNFSIFPATNPVGILFYPGAYLEDVDFDGKNDLLASPNLYARSALDNNFQKSIWFYKNTGTNQLPGFTFTKDNFLQEDIIDIGDNAKPTFTDIDGDGDEDLFVGQYVNDNFRSSLSYYQNTGTTTAPFFKFVTDDFLSLSLLTQVNIKPQFVDFDMNGGVDLFFTSTDPVSGQTNIYYVLSKSSNASSFSGQTVESINLYLDVSENVCVVDIDQDGKSDLLIGRANGALEYWRNNGENKFALIDNKFMGLGPSTTRQYLSAAAGDIDGDSHDDLVIGDQIGKLSVFGDFRFAGSNPQPVTTLIYDFFSKSYLSKNLGGRLRPAIVNLLGTDKAEIVVGNTLGGLHVLKNDNGQVLSEEPQITIFPNPLRSGQALSVKADRNMVMDIYTVLGQHIGSSDRKSVV